MKRILFDFISLQYSIYNGSALYTQKIFYEISNRTVEFYGIYDGDIPINQRVEAITKQHKITLINIRDKNVSETVNNLRIDTFFIGCAQRYNSFNLCDLKCKIVIVCHDVNDKTLEYFEIPQSKSLRNFREKYLINKKGCKITFIIKLLLYPIVLLRRYIIKIKTASCYINFKKLIQQSNVFVVTVSEYSKYSIRYFLGNPQNDIKVFYSPLSNENIDIKDEDINKMPIKDKKYFLVISIDEIFKNVALFLEQWEKFCISTNYEYYCVLIGEIRASIKNCIVLGRVSSEKLAYLYRNAFALVYPSFTEGFGFPPVEAASYATPSICSNVTSIPEICGDMPIYFSPFYPEDLYRAMIKMTEDREIYVEKTKHRFLEISQRQKQDLRKIVNLILETHECE
jgi:glycosyltransferase involved in cell wall biosynthesis